jgi:hypothetical protein
VTTRTKTWIVIACLVSAALGWRLSVVMHGIPMSPEECAVRRLESISPYCKPSYEQTANHGKVKNMLNECLGPGVYNHFTDETKFPYWCKYAQ